MELPTDIWRKLERLLIDLHPMVAEEIREVAGDYGDARYQVGLQRGLETDT